MSIKKIQLKDKYFSLLQQEDTSVHYVSTNISQTIDHKKLIQR